MQSITKDSSVLNLIMTVFHVIFCGFIIIVGFCNGSSENLLKPGGLAPFVVKDVVDGAAIVYFNYIGYDSVSTLTEEINAKYILSLFLSSILSPNFPIAQKACNDFFIT